jgi:hypothetical protein
MPLFVRGSEAGFFQKTSKDSVRFEDLLITTGIEAKKNPLHMKVKGVFIELMLQNLP